MNGPPPELSAPERPDLAGLLCARMCHDLLSPIGALANGIELLAEETDEAMRQRCLALLEQSARASSDKLRFFRLAFGSAADGAAVPANETRSLIAALAGERIALNWGVGPETLPAPAAKALLNLALIGIESLVRGGTLDIGAEQHDGENGGGCEIVVRAAGPRIAFDPALGEALDGVLPDAELSSRTAVAAMLHQLADRAGGGLQYAHGDDALILGALLPDG